METLTKNNNNKKEMAEFTLEKIYQLDPFLRYTHPAPIESTGHI